MGKRKYNAPESDKKWVPILKKDGWKDDCVYAVLSKVIQGCIEPIKIIDWNKKEIFIETCKGCNTYEKKADPEPNKKEKKKTKRTKVQKKKGEGECKSKDKGGKKKTGKTKEG